MTEDVDQLDVSVRSYRSGASASSGRALMIMRRKAAPMSCSASSRDSRTSRVSNARVVSDAAGTSINSTSKLVRGVSSLSVHNNINSTTCRFRRMGDDDGCEYDQHDENTSNINAEQHALYYVDDDSNNETTTDKHILKYDYPPAAAPTASSRSTTVPTTPNTGVSVSEEEYGLTMIHHVSGGNTSDDLNVMPQAAASAAGIGYTDDCSSLNSSSTTQSIVFSGDVAAGVHDDAALEEAFRRSRHRAIIPPAYNNNNNNNDASASSLVDTNSSNDGPPPCEVVVLVGRYSQHPHNHRRRPRRRSSSDNDNNGNTKSRRKVSQPSAASGGSGEEQKSSEEDVWAAGAGGGGGSGYLHQNDNVVRNDAGKTHNANHHHRNSSISLDGSALLVHRRSSANSNRSTDAVMTERQSVRDFVNQFDNENDATHGKSFREKSASSHRRSRQEKRKMNKIDDYHQGSKIRFSDVEIREYQRVIGDNPSCSGGPPISIGWKYNILGKVSVRDFEMTRIHANDVHVGKMKRVPVTLLSREKREYILEDFGFSRAQLADAVRKNIKVKNQRRQTVHNLSVSKFEEMIEKFLRKVKKIVNPNFKNSPR